MHFLIPLLALITASLIGIYSDVVDPNLYGEFWIRSIDASKKVVSAVPVPHLSLPSKVANLPGSKVKKIPASLPINKSSGLWNSVSEKEPSSFMRVLLPFDRIFDSGLGLGEVSKWKLVMNLTKVCSCPLPIILSA